MLQGWQPTLNGQDNRVGKLAIFNVTYGSHIFTVTYTFSGPSVPTSDPEPQTAMNTHIPSLSASWQFLQHTSQEDDGDTWAQPYEPLDFTRDLW